MEAVRPAGHRDLADLTQLAQSAVEEQRESRGGPVWFRREARADPATTLAAAIDDPDRDVVIATIDDVALAYAAMRTEVLRTDELLAVVEDVYVDPGARGVGLGELLMEEMIARASQRGCVGIDALVLPGNREAKNFFESLGMTARAILVHKTLPER